MKKSKLLVLSLLAVSAIGLTSCGQTGPQGEKGDTGAPGEKGEAGAAGQDGKDGTDGKSVLNGEGAPKDTLGVDGDSYIDYSSFDYYVKENGKWVKKGNIKGAKGDDGEQGPKGDAGSKGEKGDTGASGSQGSQGPQGATAWSNTILPSDDGYITVNKGSAVKGETVTFTIHANPNNTLKEFKLGDAKATNVIEKGVAVDGKHLVYECSVTMQDYGYVVSAEYNKGAVASISKGGYVTKDENNNTTTYTVHQMEGYVFTTLKFGENDGVITESSEDGKTFTYVKQNTDTGTVTANFVDKSDKEAFPEGSAIVNQKDGTISKDLITAFGSSQDGGAYRFVSDVLYESPLEYGADQNAITNKKIILDLNGHNLSSGNQINLGTGVEEFTIKGYGSLKSTVGEGKSALNIMIGTQTGATVTIGEHVTLTSSTASYGVSVSNRSRVLNWEAGPKYAGYTDTVNGVKATLNIEGTIDITSSYGVGLGLGVDSPATEKTEEKKEEEKSDSSQSLNNNSFSELTAFGGATNTVETPATTYNVVVNVKDGASISGISKAIELHSGQLNIEKGAEVKSSGYALYATAESADKAAVNIKGEATLSGKIEVDDVIKVSIDEQANIKSDDQNYVVYKDSENHGTITVSSMNLVDGKFTYTINPTKDYVVASVIVDNTEHAKDIKDNKLVLEAKPTDVYSITAKFVKVDETTEAVTSKGVAYDSLENAVSSLKNYDTEETVITLTKNIEVNSHLEFVSLNKKVYLNLNGHDLLMGELTTKTNDASISRITLRNAKLEVTGEGKISTSDVIFHLAGGYRWPYGYHYDNDGKLSETNTNNTVAFVETELIIDKEVATKSTGERAIGVYHTNLYNQTSNTYTDNMQGEFEKELTDKVIVNFKGKDESSNELLYVNGNIKKSGWKSKVSNHAVSGTEVDDTAHPQITIESESIEGASYIAGYCNLTVKNSTFNTRGSAFNVKSGALEFSNNTFNNNISEVSVKSPYYVGDSEGAVNGNATIWLQDGIESYAGIDSAKFTDNTFNYTYAQDEAVKAKQESSYYNVGLYGGNGKEEAKIVKPEFFDKNVKVETPVKYVYHHYKEMKCEFTFNYGTDGKRKVTAYFLTDVGSDGYSAERFKEEFGIGDKNPDFPNLGDTAQYKKINQDN